MSVTTTKKIPPELMPGLLRALAKWLAWGEAEMERRRVANADATTAAGDNLCEGINGGSSRLRILITDASSRKPGIRQSQRVKRGRNIPGRRKRLICGNCGLPIYAETTRDYRHDYTYHYYHCACKSVHNPAPNCDLPYFPANEVDDTVWAWIKNLLSDPDFMLELLNKNLEATKVAQSGAAVELDKTNADIKKQEIGLERLYTQLAADEIEQRALDRAKATIRARLDDLLAKKAELEDGIVELPSKDEITRLTRSIAVYQNTLTLDNEPFEIKSNFVKELNLHGVLNGTRRDKSIMVNCYLGQFFLLIGTPLPMRWACKLEIRQTLELPIKIK